MIRKISKLLVLAILAFNYSAFADDKIIKIGATPVPHAEILEVIKEDIAKKGYKLDIKVFNDYVIPNIAVNDGQLDANFFQHMPYLTDFNKKKKTNLVKTLSVHLEPMGVYSKKIKSLSDLKEGDKVGIPNDPTNESRALDVLVTAGLIKMNDKSLRTPKDIIENPKKLEFIEIEAAQVPRTLGDTAISVINTNYALNAGLNPLKDALAVEGKDSPYANILAVKKGNENSEKIKILNEAIQTEKVKHFIEEKYRGAIVPAF